MSDPRPTETTAQTPTSAHDAKGRFTHGNPGGPGNPYARQACLHAVANALNESATGEGAGPVWTPPSTNGLFGGLPPRIRELAQALFVVEAPSPNGDLRPAEETPAD